MKTTKRFSAVFISLVLSACMIIPSVTANAADHRLKLGDADRDGDITITDATLVQRHLADMTELVGDGATAADINCTGGLEITDATFIQRYLADIDTPYDVGEPITGYKKESNAAVEALKRRIDEYRGDLYVYKDYSHFANHYTQRNKMGSSPQGGPELDENYTVDPHSGTSCIRCQEPSDKGSWVIWQFKNGYMTEDGRGPFSGGADGIDLTGAKELRFFAKGEKGGEKIEINLNSFSGVATLTNYWRDYIVSLEGVDLSNVSTGFEYIVRDNMNDGEDDIVFYLDDIRFTGDIEYQKTSPMLMLSYDNASKELSKSAFVYDNAVSAMALISAGEREYAEGILDAFVYAVNNDRYKNGRIRTAYLAGNIASFPGWNSGARMPGFVGNNGGWLEDQYQVGCDVGNTSFVSLALLQYDKVYKTDKYLETAETLMDWVIEECSDGNVGFTAGYDGWPERYDIRKKTYKSTENNIDAYAVFRQLYAVTGKEKYRDAADSALSFILSMYSGDEGRFYTGSLNDGVSPNTPPMVLDAQVWSALALGDDFEPYSASLDMVSSMKEENGAYPFCKENKNGGFWCEGSAFTALMYDLRGEHGEFTDTMDALCKVQLDNGLFPASDNEHLDTGLLLFDGSPWEYGTSPHITPTAWFIMAAKGFNPYEF